MYSDKILPIAAAIFNQIGMSVLAVFANYAFHTNLSPRAFLAMILFIAATILGTLSFIFERNTRPPMTPKIFLKIVVMSIIGPLSEQSLYYAGIEFTTATFASGMLNLLPAITYVMACVFRLENVEIHSSRGRAKVFGTCVAIGGAMLSTFWRGPVFPSLVSWREKEYSKINNHEDFVIGSLLLVSSCMIGSFYLMIEAKVVVYPAKLTMMAFTCAIGGIISFIIALVWDRHNSKTWIPAPDVSLLANAYGGFFFAGSVCLVGWMTKKKGPVFVNIFSPIGLIATAAISYFAIHEQLYIGRVIGAFVIIVGVSFVLWGKRGEQTSQPTQTTQTPQTQTTQTPQTTQTQTP